jgi:hypothetical protein
MALALLSGSFGAALGEESEQLRLSCVGELAYGEGLPAAGPTLSFETTIPFGEGSFIALTDPQTGGVQSLVYDMEALKGSFEIKGGPTEMIVWTRATSRKAGLVGQVIGGDGDILSLAIRSAPSGSTRRPFVLFGSAGSSLYRGSCG